MVPIGKEKFSLIMVFAMISICYYGRHSVCNINKTKLWSLKINYGLSSGFNSYDYYKCV